MNHIGFGLVLLFGCHPTLRNQNAKKIYSIKIKIANHLIKLKQFTVGELLLLQLD